MCSEEGRKQVDSQPRSPPMPFPYCCGYGYGFCFALPNQPGLLRNRCQQILPLTFHSGVVAHNVVAHCQQGHQGLLCLSTQKTHLAWKGQIE